MTLNDLLDTTPSSWRAGSPPPIVTLVNRFERGYDGAVAAARTCYSASGIITAERVGADAVEDPLKREERLGRRDELAAEIYKAGHHTTFQHAHVQFALTHVSRQFLWSFLHAHPFYNSEQVSQRYVEVRDGNHYTPALDEQSRAIYLETIAGQTDAYHRLIDLLTPVTRSEYLKVFPGRRTASDRVEKDVRKRVQEIARYVLPIATHAFLYHTVSVLTLFRYYRLCNEFDAPEEQRYVVGRMVQEVLKHEPDYARILEQPLELEETLEYRTFESLRAAITPASGAQFRTEFDDSLDGRTSRLIDWKVNAESTLASSAREVLGLTADVLSDDEAIRRLLDASANNYHAESLVLTTIGKLTRALHNVHYTFRKKLSHTADSQDQRHRMTPASRPTVHSYLTEEPDFVLPELVRMSPGAEDLYREAMDAAWRGINALRSRGVAATDAAYLLPNAVSIRFTESADLLNLHHKHKMRLCYNAQEEIWRASLDEAMQVRDIHPRIGRYLLPPCTPRKDAGVRPYCPEGPRFCGVAVWKLDPSEFERIL